MGQLRFVPKSQPPEFVEVGTQAPDTTASARCQEPVQVSCGAFRVEVRPATDPATLRQVLRILANL